MSTWFPWSAKGARDNASRRAAAGIAIFAILLNSLAPALPRDIAVRSDSAWTEVCTTRGVERIALASGPVDAPAAPATIPHAAFEHCPSCVSSGVAFASPPSASVAVVVPRGADRLASPANSAARGSHDWRPAYPRAPPLFA